MATKVHWKPASSTGYPAAYVLKQVTFTETVAGLKMANLLKDNFNVIWSEFRRQDVGSSGDILATMAEILPALTAKMVESFATIVGSFAWQ